jgi:hypothetical protein
MHPCRGDRHPAEQSEALRRAEVTAVTGLRIDALRAAPIVSRAYLREWRRVTQHRAFDQRTVGPEVRGEAIDASHFLAEDRPEETAAELLAFLGPTRLIPMISTFLRRHRAETRPAGGLHSV